MKLRTGAILFALMLSVASTSFAATTVELPGKAKIENLTDEQKAARLEEIKVRVETIKNMDKSELSRAERRSLRKELKEMKQEAREMRGGIYLSVGAIIIIILLLILIL